MGSKDPIQVAREILERDLASTTEQEEILESVEEVEEDIEIDVGSLTSLVSELPASLSCAYPLPYYIQVAP